MRQGSEARDSGDGCTKQGNPFEGGKAMWEVKLIDAATGELGPQEVAYSFADGWEPFAIQAVDGRTIIWLKRQKA